MSQSVQDPDQLPYVSIIVPVCNEEPQHVRELLEAISRLDWPRDKLEILIVDDSREEVYREIAKAVEETSQKLGIEVRLLRRGTRRGYKAGALNFAIRHARGEYVSVLDVDTKPRPEYLKTLYNYVKLGYDYAQGLSRFRPVVETLTSRIAQFQEEYLNNVVYRFYTENFFLRGHTFLIRKCVLEAVGGFNENIGRLTEDVDLTVRLRLRGFRGVLVPEVLSEGYVVITYGCYLLQRARWVIGSLAVLLRYLPQILASRILTLRDKIELVHSLLTRTSTTALFICSIAPLLYYLASCGMSWTPFYALSATYLIALNYLVLTSLKSNIAETRLGNAGKIIASSLLWTSTAPFFLIYILTGGRWYVTPKSLKKVTKLRQVVGVLYAATMIAVLSLSLVIALTLGLFVLLPAIIYMLLSLIFSFVLALIDTVRIRRVLRDLS